MDNEAIWRFDEYRDAPRPVAPSWRIQLPPQEPLVLCFRQHEICEDHDVAEVARYFGLVAWRRSQKAGLVQLSNQK